MRATANILRVATVAALILGGARSGLAWGGRLHMDINRAAARAVPDEMAEWRAYDKLLAYNSIDPDLWKERDAAEGPRHYLDVERYKHVAVTNLPADYSAIAPGSKRSRDVGAGIVPWVIAETLQRLTSAMVSNRWEEAAQVAAAMGHYVADMHQPLHTTVHYNRGGVHLRWEEAMPTYFWRSPMLVPGEVSYVGDPWAAILRWIEEAHAHYKEIYAADAEAVKASSGNVESTAYYQALWDKTGPLFASQASAAATDLASLWYTAWVNAGKPTIPPPPEELPQTSIWPPAEPVLPATWPFWAGFIILAVVIVALSLRKGRHVV